MNTRNIPAIMAFALATAGCTHTGTEEKESITACTDPRPQMCTMQYGPVCGTLDDGSEKTYSTDCTACSDAAVTQHRPGEC